jgi:hypothetical protein
MRCGFTLIVLAILTPSAGTRAQAPGDSLTPRHLAGGISLLLPAAWKPVSDSTQGNVKPFVDSVLSHSRDSLLQAGSRTGEPKLLLRETAPGHAEPSARFRAAPAPGIKPGAYDLATPQQIAAAMVPLCNTLRAFGSVDVRLVSCGPGYADRAAGRTVAVLRAVRSGKSGSVTLWNIVIPGKDMVYTLTLAAWQADESRYEPLFRTIWRSVDIPSP